MYIWQVDFYRRPLKDKAGQVLWELLVCDANGSLNYSAFCPQSQANVNWLVEELQKVDRGKLPDLIQVFRSPALSLIETAAKNLKIAVEATRYTPALKQYLQQRAAEYIYLETYTGEAYNPLAIDKPPPLPLPEKLWGENWRFATISAGNLIEIFAEKPIPIRSMPEYLLPINLGLASTVAIPGVIIYGGRQAMRLAQWLQENSPVTLNYITGEPDGLILESSLVDRWIIATFTDKEVSKAAQVYEDRKKLTKGLHFFLVQPDDTGMTYSGFWLLGEVG